MAAGERRDRRPFAAAWLARPLAARMKAASRRWINERRNLAADLAQVMPWPRQAFEQTHGVRMVRPAKKIIYRGGLDILPRIHDRDPVADLISRAQVVGGEEDSDAAFFREPLEQLENLRLDRDVERGRGFIGNDELRLRQQRERNHEPLPLAAGELVRELAQCLLRLRDLHAAQHFQHRGTVRAPARAW